jgi:hypothetical protein
MRDTPYLPAPYKNRGTKKRKNEAQQETQKNESNMSNTPDRNTHNIGQDLEFTAEVLGFRFDRG